MPQPINNHYQCIFVNKHGLSKTCVSVLSKDPFFCVKEIKYKVFEDRIEFEVPTQMYNGKVIHPSKTRLEWVTFSVVCDQLECRRYDFSKESTDEKVVIYFN